jgi:hypothetical protein
MNTRMQNTLADWVRLLVLLILLVMALFTIPMHASGYKTPISVKQPVHKQLMPVAEGIISSRSQTSF